MIKQQCTTCFKIFEINDNYHRCGQLSHLQKVLIPLPKSKSKLTKLDIECIYCHDIYPKYIYEEHIKFCDKKQKSYNIVEFDSKFLEDLEQRIKNERKQGGGYNEVNEITNLMKTIKIEENHITEQLSCTICQEDFSINENVKITQCKHLFHENCMQEYLIHKKFKCPLCNKPINQDQQQE